jgi:hypothetical protein
MAADISDFIASVKREEPPTPISPPLLAIWHGLRGEWDRAHSIVQAGDDRESDWVHAWLHRIEGDLSNARYWYSRAGRTMPAGSTQEEGAAIAGTFLQAGGAGKA